MNNRKKTFGRIILFSLLLILAFPVNASAAKAKLNKTKVTITQGKTYTLKVKNTSKKFKWSSSNKKVATVNSKGKVRAVKAGTATITARCKTNAKLKLTCKVTVKAKKVAVKSVTLSKKKLSLEQGKTKTLKASVAPANATEQGISWSSSNKKVAKVSGKGKVTAVSAGKAVITAKSKSNSRVLATCTVTVKGTAVNVLGVGLSASTMELTEGDKGVLVAAVSPMNASNQELVWSSSDSNVATAVQGTVTALKAGTAVITVKSVDGNKEASCTIQVVPAKAVQTAQGVPSAAALQFVSIMQKYSDRVKADVASGTVKWYYKNGGKSITTWEKMVEYTATSGKGYCDCALLARWGLREMGILQENQNFWDGGPNDSTGDRLYFSGDPQKGVQATLEKRCVILYPNKTPNQLLAEGNLLPGDICGYGGFGHTNVYAGNGLWFDAGHGGDGYTTSANNYRYNSFGPSACVGMDSYMITSIIRIVR